MDTANKLRLFIPAAAIAVILLFIFTNIYLSKKAPSAAVPHQTLSDAALLATLPRDFIESPETAIFDHGAKSRSCENIDRTFGDFVKIATSSRSYQKSQAYMAAALLAVAKDQSIYIDERIKCLRIFSAVNRVEVAEGSDLASFLNIIGPELTALPDFAEIERVISDSQLELKNATDAAATLKERVNESGKIGGFIVGEHEHGLYEISDIHVSNELGDMYRLHEQWGPGGSQLGSPQHGLLHTNVTKFSSQGRFYIHARRLPVVEVKLNNGFTEKWPQWEEDSEWKEFSDQLQVARKTAKAARAKIATYQAKVANANRERSQAVKAALGRIAKFELVKTDIDRIPASKLPGSK